MEVGLSPGDFVLDGDPAHYPKRGEAPPNFRYTSVVAKRLHGWIKMPLGTQIDLGLRNIVFDVDPATPRKRAHPPPPNFGPRLLWPSGWMDEDAAWYGSRPRPRPYCPRRCHSSRERGTAAPPPVFGPCLLWPRSPISATAELLFVFFNVKSSHSLHVR